MSTIIFTRLGWLVLGKDKAKHPRTQDLRADGRTKVFSAHVSSGLNSNPEESYARESVDGKIQTMVMCEEQPRNSPAHPSSVSR